MSVAGVIAEEHAKEPTEALGQNSEDDTEVAQKSVPISEVTATKEKNMAEEYTFATNEEIGRMLEVQLRKMKDELLSEMDARFQAQRAALKWDLAGLPTHTQDQLVQDEQAWNKLREPIRLLKRRIAEWTVKDSPPTRLV